MLNFLFQILGSLLVKWFGVQAVKVNFQGHRAKIFNELCLYGPNTIFISLTTNKLVY